MAPVSSPEHPPLPSLAAADLRVLQRLPKRAPPRLGSYEAAFAGLPCGTLVLTPDLTVVFANAALDQLLDLPAGSLNDHALHDWLDVTPLITLAEQAFHQSLVCDTLTLCRSGHPEALAIPVRATVRLLRDAPGGESPTCCWCLKTCASTTASRATCSMPRPWPVSAPGRSTWPPM